MHAKPQSKFKSAHWQSNKKFSLKTVLIKTTILLFTMERNLQSSILTKAGSQQQIVYLLLLLFVKTLHSEHLIAYNSTPTRLATGVTKESLYKLK